MAKKKVIIIGSGFSSLAASCYLAKQGYGVKLLEKNSMVGGRARQKMLDGFRFDMGPTFYWMPDVFERFFNDFGKSPSDYYTLERLNPGYKVYFGKNDAISISDSFKDIKETFENVKAGSGLALEKFMDKAAENYRIAIGDLVYKPAERLGEIITRATLTKVSDFFKTIKGQVASYVKHPKLQKIMEFPVLFLGAKPRNTPAFYNFMNHADFKLGTWHPRGGMFKVVEALTHLAQELGVEIETDVTITAIRTKNGKAQGVEVSETFYDADIVLSGADYYHTESLLPENVRQYSKKYWDKKTMAPSALLFYVGFDTKLKGVAHHTLFFDADFEAHASTIYDSRTWPENPLFYCSFPSITDSNCAPKNKECAIFLVPIAPDLEDTPEIRAEYFDRIIRRLEYNTGQNLRPHIECKESYCVNDFKTDYNSYKGNAYGLANTLSQTHILRPRLRSKKIRNLFFCGQLTVPGPGVPPALISGKLAANLINKYYGK